MALCGSVVVPATCAVPVSRRSRYSAEQGKPARVNAPDGRRQPSWAGQKLPPSRLQRLVSRRRGICAAGPSSLPPGEDRLGARQQFTRPFGRYQSPSPPSESSPPRCPPPFHPPPPQPRATATRTPSCTRRWPCAQTRSSTSSTTFSSAPPRCRPCSRRLRKVRGPALSGAPSSRRQTTNVTTDPAPTRRDRPRR